MKIVIDCFTRLTPEASAYRESIMRELSEDLSIDLIPIYSKYHSQEIINANGLSLNNFGSLLSFKKEKKLKNALRKLKPDAFISFDVISNQFKADCLTYFYAEEFLKPFIEEDPSKKNKEVSKKLSKFNGIIVRTRFLKLFLSNHFSIDKDNILVTGQGFDESFNADQIATDIRDIRRVLTIYRISKPYLFIFGALTERTNVDCMIDAFAKFHFKFPDLKLVVASPDFKIGWDNKPQPQNKEASRILKLTGEHKLNRKVIFSGVIDREHLPLILANAEVVINLAVRKLYSRSLVETIATGAPILISDSPVMKEIAGSKAKIANPAATTSLIQALISLLGNQEEREIIVEQNRKRSGLFSWNIAAEKILHKIQKDVNNVGKKTLFVIFSNTGNMERFSKYNPFSNKFEISRGMYEKNEKADGQDEEKLRHAVLIRTFRELYRQVKKYDYTLFDKFLLSAYIIKRFRRDKKLFLQIPDKTFIKRDRGILIRLIYYFKRLLTGFFINASYDLIFVSNPLFVEDLVKYWKIKRSKLIFIQPILEEVEINEKKSSDIDKQKIKNKTNIVFRASSNNSLSELNKIFTKVNEEHKDFLVLAVTKEVSIKRIEKKLEKKIRAVNVDEISQYLDISRIYIDLRQTFSHQDILQAMDKKNACLVRKTHISSYLVKEGINGYIFSEEDYKKIAKQVVILLNNKKHLSDIQKVNFEKARQHSREEAEASLSEQLEDY